MNLSCKEMENLIQLYADGEIKENEMKALDEHVRSCPSCRRQLLEIMDLVTSLDLLGREERHKRRRSLLHPAKWTAVMVAIALFYFASPFHSPSLSPRTLAETPVPDSRSDLLLIAKRGDTSRAPDVMQMRLVRPIASSKSAQSESAIYDQRMFFLPDEQQRCWMRKMNRYVLIRATDPRSLQRLLKRAGVQLDPTLLGESSIRFPSSFVITTGENPQIETVRYPDSGQGMRKWFGQLAGGTMLTP
jgi:hypothetical protein